MKVNLTYFGNEWLCGYNNGVIFPWLINNLIIIGSGFFYYWAYLKLYDQIQSMFWVFYLDCDHQYFDKHVLYYSNV